MANLGTTELLIIALVLVLLFGGRKIPEFMRGLGEAFKEFKSIAGGDEKEKRKDKKN